MLNRRDFLGSALALAASPLLARRALGTTAEGDLWLNRLTFGATPAARAEFASLGPVAWLEAELARPAGDGGLSDRLAAARLRIEYAAGSDQGRTWTGLNELRPLTALTADPAELLRLGDFEIAMDYSERLRPAEEVISASLIRAVHAPAQLREVMTQFWHDHFNVHSQKSEQVAIHFPAWDAGLRERALGNFRDLLGFIATAPAMLVYLTNDESRASPANENFARELLELHTLGAGNYLNDRIQGWQDVPGAAEGLAAGYLDDDVYEVARCFTGWTVGDGRWLAEGSFAPKTGRFLYVESWHDPYQKRVLGREFASHRAPMADGEQVLDMLATHPATARFVCEKLARRLLADDPAADLVERLAAVFLAAATAPDQIAQVIRALVADPAFAAPPAKLRRPFEVLVASLRATGAEVAATHTGWAWELARSGWRQHVFPPPTGHPDRSDDWQSGIVLLRLAEIALYAQEPWMEIVAVPPDARLPDGLRTVGDLAAHWSSALTGQAADGGWLGAVDLDPAWDLPTDPDERAGLSAVLIAGAVLSPAFLYR